MHYYFAYGSNLHPLRLRERIGNADVVSVVEKRGLKISFAKVGSDQSGKCTFHETNNNEDTLYGVLYKITPEGKAILDKIEGVGTGYDEKELIVPVANTELNAYTYQANPNHLNSALAPFDWYKQLVLTGAHFHNLPESYITSINEVVATQDPNPTRTKENLARIEEMQQFSL